ncbi:hypothetical protein PC128_g24534 [Phytophthora cactorum]|nr:hypothetical protein PC120_g23689 [Phytophthora cactorum]KAG3056969.1 hypothetical protein PC121_g15073 [Phytophthora cactorum]KAG3143703.1 hypothetical protein PC128_g24534 [Phytophthora cactorum]KAG4040247.1 hypothetical protein PC123_g24211 [Phytophthora cactorum]
MAPRATTAPIQAVTATGARGRGKRAMASEADWPRSDKVVVELRRRRRHHKTGHYVLEYELRPYQTEHTDEDQQAGQSLGLSTSMVDCSKPKESWKTLVLKKACNEWVVQSPNYGPEADDGRRSGGVVKDGRRSVVEVGLQNRTHRQIERCRMANRRHPNEPPRDLGGARIPRTTVDAAEVDSWSSRSSMKLL